MTLYHYLGLSAFLFSIGLFGVLTRRNVIGILMSIELMFNAANINLVAFNRFLHLDSFAGHAVTVFIITVAAAEVVVGLGIVVAIFRRRRRTTADDLHVLKG